LSTVLVPALTFKSFLTSRMNQNSSSAVQRRCNTHATALISPVSRGGKEPAACVLKRTSTCDHAAD
jgi:hypothetical protein